MDDAWWRGFDDPLLAELVNRAVAGNTDLAAARARIDQSRALAKAAGAALLPSVDLTGGASRVEQLLETPVGRVTRTLGLPRGYTQYDAGAQASWEIDLFGGARRGREAARADLAAAQAEEGALRVSVASETADAYLALRAPQARQVVAEDQERNQAGLVDLVQRRFVEGLAAERELNRAKAGLEGVRARTAPLRAGIAMEMNRIDVLTGVQAGSTRSSLVPFTIIPTAPNPAGSVSAADLLRRHPDIVAAERRLAASHARVGQAISNYYPRISLSGLIGVASLGTSRLFDGSAVQASGTGGLRWRLLDFGRIDAEVGQARGVEAGALAPWRGAALRATEEVQTALLTLTESRIERTALMRQVDVLRAARRQAQDAYRAGVVGLIDVTDADRDLLFASDSLAIATGNQARAAVAAYRDLGGGWQAEAPAALASAAPGHM
ncbi:NodT family efflux transporter outer membrane factor (OMF) lipoprotein [Sphingomonas sp. BE270]|jgi:NodT family efflux transporter outer membrane factor (OMF) lipoprotein|nr:NodT family efflux transporter outer membrane factor (OMF) lipoprotein [Sphingomonas sp. BE270]